MRPKIWKSPVFFCLVAALCLSELSYASIPVVSAKNQEELLKSKDSNLAANKRLVYDFYRVVLRGRHLDEVSKFMREDYIQHNPNVETGMKGFLDFFKKLGGMREIPVDLPGLVAIQAEGDLVTMSFVSENKVSGTGKDTYTTTWFDMFRIQGGKIAEHWDCDIRPIVGVSNK